MIENRGEQHISKCEKQKTNKVFAVKNDLND